ncbi:serine protease ami-like [Danaus plexippus]|uniref:serine protease ami-like n=1 Tax=Danaus plexippus TaxID=13037 RepID=UPI002AAFE6FD|nr:serine protease ami-like [Danaus plexippus]
MILFLVIFTMLCQYCEQGLRILGGRDAFKDEFPYVVRLEEKLLQSATEDKIIHFRQICTGSALTSVWVLSAAHCTDQDFKRSLRKNKAFVRYNSHFPNITGFVTPVTKYIMQPGYIELRGTVKTADVVLIHCVKIKISHFGRVNAVDFKSLMGHEALSLGFGSTNASSFEKPLQVLKGMLSKCTDKELVDMGYPIICLSRPCVLTATICGGDSGGPVVHESGIVGVHSSSFDDCDEHTEHLELTPGSSAAIITPVSPVIDWITNIIMSKNEDDS